MRALGKQKENDRLRLGCVTCRIARIGRELLAAVKLAAAGKIPAAVLGAKEGAAAERHQQEGHMMRVCELVLGQHVEAPWAGHVALSSGS